MIMVLPTMYRDTQNRYEPNLPFAQSLSPTMFRDNQNPDTPNLPFAQSDNRSKLCYNVTFANGVVSKMVLTGSGVDYYRSLNAKVVKCSDDLDTSTGGSGYSRTQIEKIIDEYHGDDISLLHSHSVNFGKSLSSAQLHRDSIEGKVELGNTQRAEIHSKIRDLGTAVSDVSSGLESHKLGHGGNGNGNDCGWDIGCHIANFKEQVGGVALVGVAVLGGYLLLKKRIKL
jgi:hypothetical protein